VWLPEWSILAIGVTVVGLDDLFDVVKPEQMGSFGWLWVLLHCRGMVPGTNFFVLFPLIPWVGVMACGYVFGKSMLNRPVVRQRILLYLGSALTLAFIVPRGLNAYGNPTFGVAASSPGEWRVLPTTSILVFGRVPMFFYVLHLYTIHLLAVATAYIFRQPVDWLWHGSFWMNRTPEGYGHSLAFVYVM
jgi:uncharacterized membrane protein